MAQQATQGAQHTPGPWRVDVHNNVVAAGGLVAFPGIAAGFDQAANARLIAAAPELLAFAKWCISERFDSRDKSTYARAAIARATGAEA
jgi:hypothetical protein